MIQGKGQFIWAANRIHDGDPELIAQDAKDAGLSHVLIKFADGTGDYNVSVDLHAIIAALHALGIEVWGWQFVYGYTPFGEAAKAIEKWQDYDLDGWIVNAEGAYKNNPTAAVIYMSHIRPVIDKPIGLSSYRYPLEPYHPEFPWKASVSYTHLTLPTILLV